MSLIAPSFQENLYNTLFRLESDRPRYYMNVFNVGRRLFISLGFQEQVEIINKMIWDELENPIKKPLDEIMYFYDHPRFYYSKKAYIQVGDPFDDIRMSRWDIQRKLEKISNYIFETAVQMSGLIRFTRPNEVVA